MHMIATSDLKNSKQTFQSLRCGFEEDRRIESKLAA
jgi:hypothetical protein